MKNKKRLALMAVALTMMVSSSAVILATSGCGSDESDTNIEYQTLTGSYYTDIEGTENQITFSGSSFTSTLNGVSDSGSYTYDGETVTLKFSDNSTITGKFEDGNFTFTKNNVNYSMLSKIEYQVTYNLDGGTGATSEEVVNGRTATKPADPTKEGYTFVGWYTDSQYKNIYRFDTAITADTTLYARFVKALESEYTLSFDLGYEGGSVDSVTTVGGCAYNLPVPVRSGYTFVGWWASDYDSADKLTAQVQEGQTISASTTLYAVWAGNTPAVSVTSTGISWTSVGVNKTYRIVITAPDGSEEVKSVTYTNYSYNFANKDQGDYVVEIIVNGNSTFAYYKNKGLAQVSIFSVEGNVLSFNKVDNAQKYILSYECGTEGHSHTDIDLGEQTSYDFSECDTVKGGINFTVKAVADDYASSVSRAYNVNRVLDAVTGLAVNSKTDVVTWDAVEGASYYRVEITKGTNTDKYTVSDKTSYDLSSYYGDVSVAVYPVAFGYNSPDATQVNYNKTRLATPANIRVSGDTLVWDTVEDAQSYRITINGKEYSVTSASLPISDRYFTVGVVEFTLSIQAIAATSSNNSFVTDTLSIRRAAMNDNIKYANGVVTWDPVIGVTKYGIKVNDGEEVFADSSATSYNIVFTTDGLNTISVRCYDGTNASEWVYTTVNVNKVTYDANGGAEVGTKLIATGDDFTLPTIERTGYKFLGWFTSVENGSKVDDSLPYKTGNKTYYAHWSANTYTASFSVPEQEGSLNGQDSTVVVTYDQNFTFPVPVSADATKTFLGWYYGDIAYTDPFGESKNVWNNETDITLTPRWVEVFKFTLTKSNNEDCYSVTKGGGISYVKEVTVPATYNGVKVGVIEAECFKECTRLEVVNIPNTILEISIGDGGSNGTACCFYKCTSLKEVNIYTADERADANYWSTDDGILIQRNTKTGDIEVKFVPLALTGAVVIPSTVSTPEGNLTVNTIATKAFYISNITSVEIPASITKIGKQAFASSYYLKTVNFLSAADGVEAQQLDMDASVFSYCKAIESITLPARLKYKTVEDDYSGEQVNLFISIFNGCTSLTSIAIEPSDNAELTSEDGMIYADNGTTLYYCPSGYENTVEKGVITPLRINSGVLTIGNGAFQGCSKLVSIVIPGNVSTIEQYAFKNCTALSSVVFEGREDDPPLTIKKWAFYSCGSLTSVELPENLGTLEDYAFMCNNLTTVTLNSGLKDVSERAVAFSTTGKAAVVENVKLGAKATAFDILSVFGAKVKNVEVDKANTSFTSEDGVLFDNDVTQIIYFPDSKEGDYKLPASVTDIGANVFAGKMITSITIGKNVTRIGKGAFSGCTALTEITFEERSASDAKLVIESEAFKGCTGLTSITLPVNLTSIGDLAFSGCTKITDIVIPEGVESIGHYAFNTCTSLTSISLPSTLTTFGLYGVDLDSNFNISASYANDGVIYAKSGTLYYDNEYKHTIIDGGIDAFPSCGNLKTITIAAANKNFGTNDDNVIYEKDDKGELTVLNYSPTGNVGDNGLITIPSTVTRIKDRAFYNNRSITEVKFEDNSSIESGYEAFYSCVKLTKVTLPQGLKTISNGMFALDAALTEIIIPNTVTSIENKAFNGCSKLATVTFVEGGNEALVINDAKSTTSGTTVSYDTASGAFYGCTSIKTLTFPERTTKIGAYAFYTSSDNSMGIQEINFPSTLTSIGRYAFGNCKNIKKMTFTSSDKNELVIEDYAFYKGSSSSTAECSVTLPENLVSIGTNAFQYSRLTSINIPAKVTSIGQYAFANVAGLESVTIGKDSQLTEIGANAFASTTVASSRSNLESINLEVCSKLTSIGASAFVNCIYLNNVKLPASLETIGASAFSGCTGLSNFEFMYNEENGTKINNLKSVGNYAFASTSFTELTIHESTNTTGITLGDALFNKCTELKTLNLPLSVTDIGGSLKLCSSIETITVPSNHSTMKVNKESRLIIGLDTNGNEVGIKYAYAPVTTKTNDYVYSIPEGIASIGNGAFVGQNCIKKLIIPASVQKIDTDAFKLCRGLEEVEFAENSKLTEIGSTAFALCYSLKNLTLPEGVTTIGKEAFASDTSLVKVTLPKSLRVIGTNLFKACYNLEEANLPAITNTKHADDSTYKEQEYMFADCYSLKKVTIEEGATYIPKYAFENCTSLEEIVLPENTDGYTIASNAFYGCTSLKTVTILGTIKSYGVNSSTSKMSNMFYGCTALETVVLNDNITKLGNGMFYGCSSLKEIKVYDPVKKEIKENNTEDVKEVVLPSALTDIGAKTFYDTAIEKITIPDGVKIFGQPVDGESTLSAVGNDSSIFYNCSELKTVILPYGFSGIGAKAFTNCGSLYTVQYAEADGKIVGNEGELTLPDTITILGNYAFGTGRGVGTYDETKYFGCKFTKITLPDSVTTLGAGVFNDCRDLTEFTVGSGRTTLGTIYSGTKATTSGDSTLFSGCVSLTHVYLSYGFEGFGANTFYGCTNLKTVQYYDSNGELHGNENEVTLPETVKVIGNSTFYGTAIEKAYIPSSIMSGGMGTYVFQNCTSLTYVEYLGNYLNTGLFKGCTALEKVVIGDGATSFGTNMFQDCSSLTTLQLYNAKTKKITGNDGEITIPTGVTNFGTSATTASNMFNGCTSITTVNLHSKFTSMGTLVFNGCSSLTTVKDSSALKIIGTKSFLGCTSLVTINTSKLTTLGANAFQDCSALETINLSSATSIGATSFQNCTSLTAVDISKVTSLGNYAFDGCTSLSSVTFNTKLTTIGTYAFRNCESLKSVTLPTALKAISNYCFSGSGLTSITLPDTVTSIGTQSFAYSDLEEITLPAKLETIGLEAFYSTKLKSIEIPASVTSMTGNTFGDCEDLVMITTADGGTYKSEDDLLYKTVKTDDGTNNYVITHVLPAVKGEYELPSRYIIGAYALNGNDAVTKIKVTTDQLNSNALFYYYGEVEITGGTEIGSYAFANYKGTTLVIPEGVTKIDDYAFNGCSNLESIVLPSTLTSIGKYAFSGCSSLASITLPSNLETISNYAFKDCTALTSITIPESVTTVGTYLFSGCSALKEVTYNATVSASYATSTYMFKGCEALEQVTFGDKVENILSYMFQNCTALKSVVIPSNVTIINSYAFSGCTALESVVASEGLTTINASAFSGCTALKSFTIPESVTTIGGSAFSGCTSYTLEKVGSNVTSIGATAFKGANVVLDLVLPEGLTTLGSSAFAGTAITSVVIPTTLTSYVSAFSGCESLSKVTLTEGVTVIDESAFSGCTALKNITLPEGLTEIRQKAFANSGLTEVITPSTLVKLGGTATAEPTQSNYGEVFSECASLKKVVLNEGLTVIGAKLFYNCTELTEVTLPHGITTLSNAFAGCTKISKLVVYADDIDMFTTAMFDGWTADQTIEWHVSSLDTTLPIVTANSTTASYFLFKNCKAKFVYVCDD